MSEARHRLPGFGLHSSTTTLELLCEDRDRYFCGPWGSGATPSKLT